MVGILRNCKNCDFLGSDDSGDDFGSNSFPVCTRTYCNSDEKEDNTDKEGFPFKSEQLCHAPGFWQYLEQDKELLDMFFSNGNDVDPVFKRFKEKYQF